MSVLPLSASRLADYASTAPADFASHDLGWLLSQYLHGELFAARVGERLVASFGTPAVREFLDEERRHAALLERCMSRGTLVPYPLHAPVAAVYERALASEDWALPLVILTTVVEPFGLGSIQAIRPSLTDPELAATLDLIGRDEGKHLRLGPELLAELPPEVDLTREVVAAFAAMLDSTHAAPVFARLFATHWERELWQTRACLSKSHRRQSRRVLAAVLGQLKHVAAAAGARDGIARMVSEEAEPAKLDARSVVKTAHPHYDDGNELFTRIIGPSMAYSSALYGEQAATLEEAQTAKFDRIAAYSGVGPKTRSLLDLGCGWGGYLRHVARTHPQIEELLGFTVSREQAAWFAANAGTPQAEIRHGSCFDFLYARSEADAPFDAVSSIEALEHFASPEDYRLGRHRAIYREFFRLVRRTTAGRFGFETIVATKDVRGMPPDEARKALRFALFMLRDVYPNSHLSSPADLELAAAPYFRVAELEVVHEDYARTLEAWLANLDAATRGGGSDPRAALYRKYFEMCIEQFRSGAIGLLRASFEGR
jgi:cyclopropane-fatty-acyl-phospholipid synthase